MIRALGWMALNLVAAVTVVLAAAGLLLGIVFAIGQVAAAFGLYIE